MSHDPLHSAQRRKPSPLDVQVAYDALVQRCVSAFNAGSFVSPALIAIAVGACDGEIEMVDNIELTNVSALMAPGRDGPVMDEFIHRALNDEVFRQSLLAAGHQAADMLVFLSEVTVQRDAENGHEALDEDAIMVIVFTADQSFRSMLAIEMPQRQAFYAPLQMDVAFSGTEQAMPGSMALMNMASSMPFLAAAHPLHDLHTRCSAALH